MVKLSDRSEFDGGGVMPNTVYPKGTEALTASDKLRLQSITGQEDDSRAPVDPYFWQGNPTYDPTAEEVAAQESRLRAQQLVAQERDRYKESQY